MPSRPQSLGWQRTCSALFLRSRADLRRPRRNATPQLFSQSSSLHPNNTPRMLWPIRTLSTTRPLCQQRPCTSGGQKILPEHTRKNERAWWPTLHLNANRPWPMSAKGCSKSSRHCAPLEAPHPLHPPGRERARITSKAPGDHGRQGARHHPRPQEPGRATSKASRGRQGARRHHHPRLVLEGAPSSRTNPSHSSGGGQQEALHHHRHPAHREAPGQSSVATRGPSSGSGRQAGHHHRRRRATPALDSTSMDRHHHGHPATRQNHPLVAHHRLHPLAHREPGRTVCQNPNPDQRPNPEQWKPTNPK